jgi:hypothetical protein
MLRTCNYGSCEQECGEAGVVVSLHRQDDDAESRAVFCCAAHAAAALTRLAEKRNETVAKTPQHWRAP